MLLVHVYISIYQSFRAGTISQLTEKEFFKQNAKYYLLPASQKSGFAAFQDLSLGFNKL